MPIDEHGAGYGRYTELKQTHFRTIAAAHLAIVKNMLTAHPGMYPRYVYVDLTAGPGVVDGEVGSPLIFLEAAGALGVPHEAFLIEQDRRGVSGLVANLRERAFTDTAVVLPGDHAARIDDVLRALGPRGAVALGLAYADPNGDEPPWDVLERLGRRLRRVDLLLYLSAAFKKWLRGCGLREDTFLLDRLAQLHKRYLLLRRPAGGPQYTFALLTNWAPLTRKFRAQGFYPPDSPEGAAIADRLNLTDAQLRAKYQSALPLEEDIHP
jgi:hypothetical protein